MKNLFLKNIISIIVFIFLFAVGTKHVFASVNYPVPELGNCRDRQECYLYCQIPANTPSCWSYGKYILAPSVLGVTTLNLTFPIAELGNCTDAQACFIYCNQPANQAACLSFAQKNGLIKTDAVPTPPAGILDKAKTQLGCTDQSSCLAFCQLPENAQKCADFAKANGLAPNVQASSSTFSQVATAAQTELGCNSETSCFAFCHNPQNSDKCLNFAASHNLMPSGEVQKAKQMLLKTQSLLTEAETALGCNSVDSCKAACNDAANLDKCMNLGRKFGLSASSSAQLQGESNGKPGALPCSTETECRAYCQAHPDQCPGFIDSTARQHFNALMQNGSSDSGNFRTGSLPPQTSPAPGQFLGPGGCKTEEECRAFCQNHPDACPGFKQNNPVPTVAFQPSSTGRFSGHTFVTPTSVRPTFQPPINGDGQNSGNFNSNFKPPTGGNFNGNFISPTGTTGTHNFENNFQPDQNTPQITGAPSDQ